MDAEDVSRLVREQIGTRESLPNHHEIDLRRCLTKPTRIQAIHRYVVRGQLQDTFETVWLVLEEDPVNQDGYKIVFSEQRQSFGLATSGRPEDPYPSICGYYGDFPTALACM